MLSVLFIILKIIGIVLLAIVILLLLLFFCILFVPARYRITGSYEETFVCKAKITWLLHFIVVKINVEKETVTSIRILGIPLSVFLRKKKEPAVEKQKTNKPAVEKQKTNKPAVEKQNINKPQHDANGDKETDTSCKSEKITFFKKIKSKIQKIINLFNSIINQIKLFFTDIKEKKDRIKRYLSILKSDAAKASFLLCKKKLFKILKHFIPRKMHANITYGLSDPADTGYILALYSILPEAFGKKVVLYPDFNQAVFKCDFRMKGLIRMWTLLHQILSVIVDKNCKNFYKTLKKEIANE